MLVCRACNTRYENGREACPSCGRRSSRNGETSTALCPDHVQDVIGAACFNDARVEVAAL